jgi:hypothetical protein
MHPKKFIGEKLIFWSVYSLAFPRPFNPFGFVIKDICLFYNCISIMSLHFSVAIWQRFWPQNTKVGAQISWEEPAAESVPK